jgi:protein O-mannosyl-transferase
MTKPTLPYSLNRDWILGLILFVAVFLTYQPAWYGQPVWDDELHMTPSELRSFDGLVHIWTQPRGTVQYFPLVHTVFWIEAMLWGDSTFGYHVLNILLHFFSAMLLILILQRLGIRGAWLAGGIFALHPVMVESVAWITELKNTLSGVFFLSAALAYLSYAENAKKKMYLFALGLFILGLLSKTGIAPFPLALLAILWWKNGSVSWRRDGAPLSVFLLVGVAFGLLTVYVEQIHIGTKGPMYDFSFIERSVIAGRAFWFYLGKIILPVDLMISYPRWVVSQAVWWQYLFPAAALGVGCMLWTMRNKWRAPAAIFFYFTAMVLPYLGFVSMFAFRYSFVADHYQYLAAIGPIAMVASLVDKVVGSERRNGAILKPAISMVLLVTLGILSWKQSGMYRDAQTLYRITINKNPDSWMAHNNLGLLLANNGRPDEAMVHFQKALELNLNYAEAHNNLGLLLTDMKRRDEAMAHFQKALEINQNYGGAHFNFAILLATMGQSDEAMDHYQRALQINPHHSKTHNNLGLLLASMGKPDEAIAHYKKALEINPASAEIHYNLGLLLANVGRDDEAMVHLMKALERSPNLAVAHSIVGILLAKKQQFDEAMPHFQKALELNPRDGAAHYNLGLLLSKMGREDEAQAHFRRASELNQHP